MHMHVYSHTQHKERYFPFISSMQLELLLSQILDLNSGILKPCNKGGQYGIQLTDLVSLTFSIIHSVRSVTFTEFQVIRNNGYQKQGSNGRNNNYCALKIAGEVPESIVSTVHANARCVVLTAVASAMQWHLMRLLSYTLPPSSSSSMHSPSSSSSSKARSLFTYRYMNT